MMCKERNKVMTHHDWYQDLGKKQSVLRGNIDYGIYFVSFHLFIFNFLFRVHTFLKNYISVFSPIFIRNKTMLSLIWQNF